MQPQQSSMRVRKTPVTEDSMIEDSLPSLVLLNSARKSGVLRVEPETALEFLREYQRMTAKPSGTWEQKLCDSQYPFWSSLSMSDMEIEHQIDLTTVTTLASILRRSKSKGQLVLARKVMLTASALGDKSATFDIISSAIRIGNFNGLTAPLQRLDHLANKDNDPQALSLLGQIYYARQEKKQALEYFRKATGPPTGNLEFFGAGEALVNEGKILIEMDDKDGAKVAFEKAALELDEPSGYFYLSKMQEPGSSQEQVYLLKAASSGIQEAWHNLGALEMMKRKDNATLKPKTIADFGMAYEWFQVAAADGFGLSMLNLALMCKSVGNIEEGRKWLEKAEENEDVRDQARAIKANFHDDNVDAI
ncbi:hypothetical protein EG329_011591 [Mollisiaceae sp. DMI_Dod_QoI]|nr:hypothetical protein EG329_011591 [Helotiales sp. DMI_Dod_QoI]